MKELPQTIIEKGLNPVHWRTLSKVHTDLGRNGVELPLSTVCSMLRSLARQGKIKRKVERGFTYYRRL